MKRKILLFEKKKPFQLLVSLELFHQFSWCFLLDILLKRPKTSMQKTRNVKCMHSDSF